MITSVKLVPVGFNLPEDFENYLKTVSSDEISRIWKNTSIALMSINTFLVAIEKTNEPCSIWENSPKEFNNSDFLNRAIEKSIGNHNQTLKIWLGAPDAIKTEEGFLKTGTGLLAKSSEIAEFWQFSPEEIKNQNTFSWVIENCSPSTTSSVWRETPSELQTRENLLLALSKANLTETEAIWSCTANSIISPESLEYLLAGSTPEVQLNVWKTAPVETKKEIFFRQLLENLPEKYVSELWRSANNIQKDVKSFHTVISRADKDIGLLWSSADDQLKTPENLRIVLRKHENFSYIFSTTPNALLYTTENAASNELFSPTSGITSDIGRLILSEKFRVQWAVRAIRIYIGFRGLFGEPIQKFLAIKDIFNLSKNDYEYVQNAIARIVMDTEFDGSEPLGNMNDQVVSFLRWARQLPPVACIKE